MAIFESHSPLSYLSTCLN